MQMMMGCTRKHREKNDKKLTTGIKIDGSRYLLDIDLKTTQLGLDGMVNLNDEIFRLRWVEHDAVIDVL